MKKVVLLIPFLIFFIACENETDDKINLNDDLNKTEKVKNLKFTASSENVAEVGEVFQVVFEINANPTSFTPPDFANFDVLSGPARSSYSSTQYINGKTKKEVTDSYTYTISSDKSGEFMIKEAEAEVDGNLYKSNTLKVNILGEDIQNIDSKEIPKEIKNSNKDFFITTQLSKSTVFNGEFIIAESKIYVKKEFHNIVETNYHDFNGFKLEILEAPRQLNFHNEIINGQKYQVALLKKVFLLAQKPGNYNISPYNVELKIRKKDGQTQDIFGNIVDKYKILNKKVRTDKINIIVKPLPKPVPENFSGITGTGFKIRSNLERSIIKTDDGTNFKVTVSGNGNIHLLNDLNFKLPEGLSFFKPEIEKSESYSEKGLLGERTFNYIIVGNNDGSYRIEALKFTYFNSLSEKYETIIASEHEVIVGKGIANKEITDINNEFAQKDIRFISTSDSKLKKHGKAFVGTGIYYFSFLILSGFFIMFIFLKNKRMEKYSDIKSLKMRKAKEISGKRLNIALKHMKMNENKAFYKEILNVLWGYLSDKLSVPTVALTKDSIEEILREKNTDLSLISKFQSVIELCGYAEYGPVGEEGAPELVYNETKNLIENFENIL